MNEPRARRLVEPVQLPICDAVIAEPMSRHSRCSNQARYSIGGKTFCGRHAGAAALQILLEERDAS